MNADVTDFLCSFCGYEPYDPDGIYSETFEAYVCGDCEAIAIRILTSAAEAGEFCIGIAEFEVRIKKQE